MQNSDKRTDDGFINIPSDLMQFLKQDTYSLLIKGDAGTGKTTLALSILRLLGITKNCMFVSTRNSPNTIFQHHIWLENYFADSKKSKLDEVGNEPTEKAIFVDGRLDEPIFLFERITNQLMDTRSPMIIVDSWEDIGYLINKEEFMTNARVLQTWRERSGAKIIFITNNSEDTTFDFLVDGIIELRKKSYNDRTIREIHLSKLRGIRINRPFFVFTLHDSIFRSYEPYTLGEFVVSSNVKSQSSLTKNRPLFDGTHITSGYQQLDNLLEGGITPNSIINVELDSHINAKVAMIFLGKIVSRFVSNGNPVLFQSLEGIHRKDIENYLHTSTSFDKDLIQILQSVELKSGGSSQKHVIKKSLSFQENVFEMKKRFPKSVLLGIMGSDIIRQFYTMEESNKINELIDFVKSNIEVSIFVTRQTRSHAEHLSGSSDIHLKLLEINGTLFLQPQIPWSHLYAITINRSQGYPEMNLEPIV